MIFTMYKLNVDQYVRIGTSVTVQQWLTQGVPLPLSSTPDQCFNRNRVFSDKHADFVDTEINRLLSIGAIERVSVKPHYQCEWYQRKVENSTW